MRPAPSTKPATQGPSVARQRRLGLRGALGIAIAVAFVVIVEHSVGLGSIVAAWRQLPIAAWLPVLMLLALTYALRAERLRAHLGAHSRTPRRLPSVPLYLITLRHNLLNLALPMRLGEWSLPVLLRERFRIPLAEGSGGLVWLRLLDLHSIIGLAALALAVIVALVGFDVADAQRLVFTALSDMPRLGDRIVAPGHSPSDAIRVVTLGLTLMTVLAFVTWIAGWHVIRRLPSWIETPAAPSVRLPRWIDAIAARCADGLPAAGDRRALRAALAWTLANWLVKLTTLALLTTAFLHGLGVTADWPVALLIGVTFVAVIVAELTSVLPIHAPFGLGTYAAGLWVILAGAGLPADAALIAATATHIAFFGFSGLLGTLAFLWPLGLGPKPSPEA